MNGDIAETVGWPRFADTVAGVWASLPAAERERAVVFTGNYGEAGAIDRFGPERGLPRAYSGHNGYAYWDVPPDSATTAVVIGVPEPTRFFGRCERAATVDNGVGVDNEEQGRTVWVCRDPVRPWSALWPQLRHLS